MTTLECASGLRSQDNRNYAVNGDNASIIINGIGKPFTVEGTISPPSTESIYDTAGTIDVIRVSAN